MAIEVHVIKMYLDTQLNAVISKIPYTMTQKPVPVFTLHPFAFIRFPHRLHFCQPSI